MKAYQQVVPILMIASGMLTGCQTVSYAPPPQTTQIQCAVPKIERLAETPEAQSKGDLEIAMVPSLYKAVRVEKINIKQTQASMGEQVALGLTGGAQGQVFVEKITSTQLKAQPARLEFTVRINNKLDRVFRGQGSVVQFNVAGKLVPFGNTDYKEFIGGIVPPRNETEFKIYGPTLDMIPGKCTIGIFLYDVVTATDVAGNTTEKQNYEWYFTYTTDHVTDTAEIRVERGLMPIEQYQQYLRQRRVSQNQ